jgi:chromate reductase
LKTKELEEATMMTTDATPLTVLAIAGSLRRDSFNRRLLHAAQVLAPPLLEVQVYDGLGSIPMFNEDIETGVFAGGAVPDLRDRIAAADALLIATPEYNQSMPAVLKNLLDWMSRPGAQDVLAGKPVAVIGATAGRWGTRLAQAALRQVLVAMESRVLPGPALYLAGAAGAFDGDGMPGDPEVARSLRAVLAAIEGMVRLTPLDGHGPYLVHGTGRAPETPDRRDLVAGAVRP